MGSKGGTPAQQLKTQHECLAKMDISGQFGCSSCQRRRSSPAVMQCRSSVQKTVKGIDGVLNSKDYSSMVHNILILFSLS